jgi:predicted Fe-Mo cluster-binding NifX family protein
MKVAISSKGDTLDSEMDSRFGRCKFFAIYDSEDKSTLFIANTAATLTEGAGPAALQLLTSQGVSKLVSGNFGVKIKTLSSDLNVQLIVMRESHTIESIINILNH